MKSKLTLLALLITAVLFSQNKEVKIKINPLTDSIYMLTGQGGNIGVFRNEKGLFMIDDQFAKLSDKILASLKTISNQPINMVINTHYHGDHTGGNINMAKQGATIFAQKNVRTRMESKQKEKDEVLAKSLPVITFDEGLQLYFDKENINAFHVHNAHTDGDALIYFSKGNVLHMGDTFFNGRYPYIDLNAGGSIKGYIKASEKALMICNDATKIIPGHGNLATVADLKIFLQMLKEITNNVQKEIDTGKTEAEILKNTSITATYDAKGYGDGFINSERMRKTVYQSLIK